MVKKDIEEEDLLGTPAEIVALRSVGKTPSYGPVGGSPDERVQHVFDQDVHCVLRPDQIDDNHDDDDDDDDDDYDDDDDDQMEAAPMNASSMFLIKMFTVFFDLIRMMFRNSTFGEGNFAKCNCVAVSRCYIIVLSLKRCTFLVLSDAHMG